MNRLLFAAGVGCVLGALSATQLAGPVLAQSAEEKANIYEQLDLFGDIFERIRSQYVEEVDEADLIEAAINGMLTRLTLTRYLPQSDQETLSDARRIWRARN